VNNLYFISATCTLLYLYSVIQSDNDDDDDDDYYYYYYSLHTINNIVNIYNNTVLTRKVSIRLHYMHLETINKLKGAFRKLLITLCNTSRSCKFFYVNNPSFSSSSISSFSPQLRSCELTMILANYILSAYSSLLLLSDLPVTQL